MDLRSLRQLVALAEAGNYRRAAEQLGITHSALSQAIGKLEAEYGVDLFVRSRRETVPTAFGHRLVEAAAMALGEVEEAERDIDLMRNLEAGRLVIGADPNVSEALLAPALVSLLADYPKLRFTVLARNWVTMEDDLRSRRIDLYLGLRPDRRYDGISFSPIELPPPVVACRAGHPLTKIADLDLGAIMRYPVLGGDAPAWFLLTLQEAYPDVFPDFESLRSVFLISHDLGLLRAVLIRSDAVALVPLALVARPLRAGKVALLDPPGYPFTGPIPGVIATADARSLPPAAEALRSRIEEMLAAAFAPPQVPVT